MNRNTLLNLTKEKFRESENVISVSAIYRIDAMIYNGFARIYRFIRYALKKMLHARFVCLFTFKYVHNLISGFMLYALYAKPYVVQNDLLRKRADFFIIHNYHHKTNILSPICGP